MTKNTGVEHPFFIFFYKYNQFTKGVFIIIYCRAKQPPCSANAVVACAICSNITWAISPTPLGPIVQAQWLIPAWPKITCKDLPQCFVYSSLITAVPQNDHLVSVFTLCATNHTTTNLMWSIWRGLVIKCVSVPLPWGIFVKSWYCDVCWFLPPKCRSEWNNSMVFRSESQYYLSKSNTEQFGIIRGS